ncbi:MAG TPA: hypothetical protein VFE25_02575 [Opitutaceae bacterium]|jgi:hypothetical protein|nr:hypothetical protein [Opitutaceae bacterium]
MTGCFQRFLMGSAMIAVGIADTSAEDEPHASSSYMSAAISSVPPKFDPTPPAGNADRAYDAGGANNTIPYPHPPPAEKN